MVSCRAIIIDTKIHICFVAPHAYPLMAGRNDIAVVGGAELQQYFLARGLVERGFEVSMVCLDYGQPDVSRIDGITVHRAFRPDAGIPIIRFLHPRLTSIWSCLKRADADIYYSRAAGILAGIVARFCRQHSRKSIFAAAGNPDFDRKTSRIRFKRDRWIYEYGLRASDELIAQNLDQVGRCELNFKRTPTLIENCYPLPARGRADCGKHVLWVSTIREIKRPELLLDLAQMLPEFSFIMIGGPDNREHELFNEIQSRANTISNLQFVGFVPYREIDRYFDDAQLVLNTSESEGFPNTFLQAWSRGVPTVSLFDCGAQAGGKAIGRVVSDETEMAEQIAALMRDHSQWVEESRTCLAYYEQHHLPDVACSNYERVFEKLLGLEAPKLPNGEDHEH